MTGIWKYQSYLPTVAAEHRVHLGEGQTPLIRSRAIAGMLGLNHLYFKLENLNPTGSYKDRFAAVLVSLLASRNQQLCIATSSGNTGAALAAYCAAAGIKCFVATVDGAPVPKIKQMQLYGASICLVAAFGRDPVVTSGVFAALADFVAGRSLPLPISAYCYCPEGMQGVQTIAYEIMDEMKDGIDHIFSPAGGGGLCLAMAKGVIGYMNSGYPHGVKLHCVQPFGNNTIAGPLSDNSEKATAVAHATTAVSGLQVPGVLDGDEVIRLYRQLGGNGFLVHDQDVFRWQQQLATKEGIFSEPAGAVALSGLATAVEAGAIGKNEKVVCLVTGSGFKDMNAVENNFNLPPARRIENIQLLNEELKYL